MKIAGYCLASLFVVILVAILAGLIIGFSTGAVGVEGSELLITLTWQSHTDQLGGFDIMTHHIHGPIYGFAIVAALPLTLLAILAAVLLGRSSDRRPS